MKIFAAHDTNRILLLKAFLSFILMLFTMLSFCQNKKWQAYFDSIEKVQDIKQKAFFDSCLIVLNSQDRFIGMTQLTFGTNLAISSANQEILAGNSEQIYSIKKESGDTNWLQNHKNSIFHQFYTHGDKIIVRGYSNVSCLIRKTGLQKWITPQQSGRNKFVIYKDLLIISEYDTIKALDINNGNCLWKFISDTLNKRLYLELYENSVIWGDRKDNLYRLDLDTKELIWEKSFPKFDRFNLLNDKILLINKNIPKKIINIKSGSEIGSYNRKVYSDYIYDVTEKGILKRNTRDTIYFESLMTDSILWSFALPGDLRVGPIKPFSKLIYNNVAYLPGSDGILYALDIDSGEVLWKFNTISLTRSILAFDDGVLYLINGNAQLIAIDLDLSDVVNKWKNNLYLSE